MSKADNEMASPKEKNQPTETTEATEKTQIETQPTKSTKGTRRKKQAEQEQDDDFGNRVDYVSQSGLGGVYREPMQGGTQWGFTRNHRGNHRNNKNHRNNRRHRHQQQHHEQEGVLTIRQPAWKERIQSSEGNLEQQQAGVLTIRQQGDLARSLRWGHKNQQTYISKPGSDGRKKDRRRHNDDQSQGSRSKQKNNRNRRTKSNHHGRR